MKDVDPEPSQSVLLVQHCPQVGGSAVSGLITAQVLRSYGLRVDVALGDDGPFAERFRNTGFRVWIVPHHNCFRNGGPVRMLRRLVRETRPVRGFRSILRQESWSLVYVNTLVSVAAAIAARREGIPCVWHIRELFDDVGGEMVVPRWGGRTLLRRLIWSCADQVIVNSEAVAQNILGCAEHSRLSVVPNSVDDRLFESVEDPAAARREFGVSSDALVVGVPGTLRPMKGHSFFLRAAAIAAETCDRMECLITGTGQPDYEQELRRLTDQLGLAGRVRFCGQVDDMRRFFSACDVICIPSRAEPFGRVAIEAFAAAKPVIASAVGGLQEIVEDGVTGLLVPYGDDRRLAEQLAALLRDAKLQTRLADAARRQAGARYTESQYADAIGRVVNDALSGQRQRVAAHG